MLSGKVDLRPIFIVGTFIGCMKCVNGDVFDPISVRYVAFRPTWPQSAREQQRIAAI